MTLSEDHFSAYLVQLVVLPTYAITGIAVTGPELFGTNQENFGVAARLSLTAESNALREKSHFQ